MKILWIIWCYSMFVFGLIVFIISIWHQNTDELILGGTFLIWGRIEMISAERNLEK